MDLSRHCILLNGEPRTLQIDTIEKNGSNGYYVRFKNSSSSFGFGIQAV